MNKLSKVAYNVQQMLSPRSVKVEANEDTVNGLPEVHEERGMDKLISVVNKIQDIFNTLAISNQRIQLPQIVMVGAQSSGKSSTLESLVRHSFLPRGSGIVTRCPLFLQLINCPMKDRETRKEANGTNEIEVWGQFNNKPEIFTDFDEIREEIERLTDEIAGSNKGISSTAINLKIYSPYVVNLTLVDLPGITKIPVADQPADIEQQIMKLVMEYVKNPNSIILAVSAANQDVATSESLKIAKEVDPEGVRTLAILTKLDTVGEDAIDILTGDIRLNIPVKLGIIGIMNRDAKTNRSIPEQMEHEREFLVSKYPEVCHQNGIPYMEKSLSQLLVEHIHKCLPDLRDRIAKELAKNEDIMSKCGVEVTDKNRVGIAIILDFIKSFVAAIDGTRVDVDNDLDDAELIGGPAIRRIFDEKYARDLRNIEAQISKEAIIAYLKRSGGVRPPVFPSETLFEAIVLKQIERLREPSMKCAETVMVEMEKVIKNCVDVQCKFYVTQFPSFMRKLKEAMLKFLHDQMPRTREFIKNIVDTETACVNTNHPDFLKLKEVLTEIEEDLSDCEDTTKLKMDAEEIEKLINGYFLMEKAKIEDSVPKSVVFTLVNFMKQNAQVELFSAFYKPGGSEMLAESDAISKMRKDASKMLKGLRAANTHIDEVYELKI